MLACSWDLWAVARTPDPKRCKRESEKLYFHTSMGWCRPESFSSRGETDIFQYSALDVPSVDGSDADQTARLYCV